MRRKVDRDTERGVSNAFRSIYEPEHASIERFDDLIAKLSSLPGAAPPASSLAPPKGANQLT